MRTKWNAMNTLHRVAGLSMNCVGHYQISPENVFKWRSFKSSNLDNKLQHCIHCNHKSNPWHAFHYHCHTNQIFIKFYSHNHIKWSGHKVLILIIYFVKVC